MSVSNAQEAYEMTKKGVPVQECIGYISREIDNAILNKHYNTVFTFKNSPEKVIAATIECLESLGYKVNRMGTSISIYWESDFKE